VLLFPSFPFLLFVYHTDYLSQCCCENYQRCCSLKWDLPFLFWCRLSVGPIEYFDWNVGASDRRDEGDVDIYDWFILKRDDFFGDNHSFNATLFQQVGWTKTPLFYLKHSQLMTLPSSSRTLATNMAQGAITIPPVKSSSGHESNNTLLPTENTARLVCGTSPYTVKRLSYPTSSLMDGRPERTHCSSAWRTRKHSSRPIGTHKVSSEPTILRPQRDLRSYLQLILRCLERTLRG